MNLMEQSRERELSCESRKKGRVRPLQVVHVVLSLDFGGLERVVLSLVAQGMKQGQRLGVVCLERPGILAPQVEALGAWVACIDKPPGIRPGTIGRLGRFFSEVRPDIVHTHQVGALFYAGPASRRKSCIPVVHTEHGKHYEQGVKTRWLGRIAGRFADRFFCVSQDIATSVLSHRIVPDRKVFVVRNGIDTARFCHRSRYEEMCRALGIPLGVPIVGTIGRLCEIKRQDLLLHAFARIRSRIPEARLLIVGDGPLMGSLRSLASDLGLEPCCHFVGYQAEPESYLQLMDVFALTSRSEGMPLVLLESWAAGVPVIAARVGGLPELVRDRSNGLLFDSGDEHALAAALETLLANPVDAKRMGDQGRRMVVSQFDVSRMAGDYQIHYLDLLHEGRTGLDEFPGPPPSSQQYKHN